jgi:hypothetical protein
MKSKMNINEIKPLEGKLITAGHPRSFKSIKDLEDRANEYLTEAEEADEPTTMAGLAVACGVSKDTLNVYAKGDYDTDDEKYSVAVRKIRTRIEANKLKMGLMGKTNAAITMFDLKNNHGYADKTQVETKVIKEERTTLNDIELARGLAFLLRRGVEAKKKLESESSQM